MTTEHVAAMVHRFDVELGDDGRPYVSCQDTNGHCHSAETGELACSAHLPVRASQRVRPIEPRRERRVPAFPC